MKKTIITLALAVSLAASAIPTTAFADESTTQTVDHAYDANYPLAGMLEELGLNYTGVVGWTDLSGWESNMLNGSRLPADGKYFYTNYGSGGLYAFACALSGEPYQNDLFGRTDPIEVIAAQNNVSYAEGQQMVAIVRDFLNSFDWKNADDQTKAQKAAELVVLSSFKDNPRSGYISNILLDKAAMCNDFAATFQLLTRLMGMDSLHVHYSIDHQWNYVRINGQWKRFDGSVIAKQNMQISFSNIPSNEVGTATVLGLGNMNLWDFLN